jgi:hypothetical protein
MRSTWKKECLLIGKLAAESQPLARRFDMKARFIESVTPHSTEVFE